jgi:predicted nucleic acid-binding protein
LIYVDSSVLLGYLLAETRKPSNDFWGSGLVSSRLLEYEVWNRLHARQVVASRGFGARALLAGVELMELSETVLARGLEPWPTAIRTLDALHLATADYLRRQGEPVQLASYDNRLLTAAQALGKPLATL